MPKAFGLFVCIHKVLSKLTFYAKSYFEFYFPTFKTNAIGVFHLSCVSPLTRLINYTNICSNESTNHSVL